MTSSIFPLSVHSILLVVQCPFHGLKLPKLRGGIGQTRGLQGIGMHFERKIAVNQIHLARNHVVVDHLLDGGLKKIAACRALKIAEDFHRDGRVRRADRFSNRSAVQPGVKQTLPGRLWRRGAPMRPTQRP